jgi:hypothetical protein
VDAAGDVDFVVKRGAGMREEMPMELTELAVKRWANGLNWTMRQGFLPDGNSPELAARDR